MIFQAPATLTRLSKPKKDMTGQQFGRLTVIGYPERDGHNTTWLCKCSCGENCRVSLSHLKTQHTKSCGCYRADFSSEKFRTHGKKRSRVYNIWAAMIQRCYNINSKSYQYYGARGIRVCDDWFRFENFYAGMGDPPAGMQLDRVNNDDNYYLENCRWTDRITQANNKRSVPKVTWNGQSLSLTQWSRIVGLDVDTLRTRIYTCGWTVDKAFTEPIRVR